MERSHGTSEQMHLLLVEYTGTEQAAEPYFRDHAAYLERHHRAGTFLVSGQTVPTDVGGAIIAHGVDRAEIERITSEDPFVQAGVAAYRIVTITPGRRHPALKALT
ncbi:YciI family protein [Spirillospora sp. NPDC029432]|uniref:YciI family protein n=1 Tax=Spirillospora sp. NPDC029432 TaxID=3154599 RepID=UPI0034555A32